MKLRSFLLLMTMTAWASPLAHAQVQRVFSNTNPAGADWYNTANWSDNLVPTREYSEIGMIGSNLGANRYAYVDTPRADTIFDNFSANPGEIRLGVEGGGNANILEIRNGGTMHVELVNGDLTTGGIVVGSPNGNGTLRVLPGGSLNVDGTVGVSFTAAPNGPSTVVVGGAAAGTATLNAGAGNFAGIFQPFANSNVNFSNSLTFTGQGVFRPEIRNGSNAKVNVTNVALLAGALTVDFANFTPNVGQSWTLIDAADIQGNFGAVNSPQIGVGQTLVPSVVAAGGRELLNVTYSTSLVLTVDRDSGAVSITNPNSPSIQFDGYSIRSASSKLDPTKWTSLDAGNLLGGDWRESNPAETRISELKPDGSGTLAGNSNVPLGNIYDPNSAPFTSGEDLVFDYTNESGAVITGQIVYTGTRVNNLLLQVDPTSGEAKLRNTSATTVTIDGYDIASGAGSLLPGTWDSLDSQGADGNGWVQTPNSNPNRLSELMPDSAATLAPGAEYSLGEIFNQGTQDLVFSFLQAGDQFATPGVVLYSALSTALDGDFDNDGDVDGRDFLAWQRGSSPNPRSSSDLALWRSNYGAGGMSAAAAVAIPEPCASLLMLTSLAALAIFKR